MAQPTPHYNSSILEDMAFESTTLVLKETLAGNEAMRDAVLLLKVCGSLDFAHKGIKLITIFIYCKIFCWDFDRDWMNLES